MSWSLVSFSVKKVLLQINFINMLFFIVLKIYFYIWKIIYFYLFQKFLYTLWKGVSKNIFQNYNFLEQKQKKTPLVGPTPVAKDWSVGFGEVFQNFLKVTVQKVLCGHLIFKTRQWNKALSINNVTMTRSLWPAMEHYLLSTPHFVTVTWGTPYPQQCFKISSHGTLTQ